MDPGSAAHHAAKCGALRSIRGMARCYRKVKRPRPTHFAWCPPIGWKPPHPADHETPFMTDLSYISPLDQARILSEALPHMQQYDDETIVIKYGGHAMGAEEVAKAFARDIVLLEQTAINPVVVHGGGPQIATMLK